VALGELAERHGGEGGYYVYAALEENMVVGTVCQCSYMYSWCLYASVYIVPDRVKEMLECSFRTVSYDEVFVFLLLWMGWGGYIVM
jgi:hypothetical protein